MSEELKLNEMGEEATDMGALLAAYEASQEEITRGKVVEGVIVDQMAEGWLVDVGYKCEGFLPRREWTHHVLVGDEAEPKVGDAVKVQVTNKRDGEEAQLVVSRWRCEFDDRWAEMENRLGEGEMVKVKGLRKVKGGLIVDCCSLEGFIPISHLGAEGRGVNPGKFIDEEFEVQLLEKDKRKRRLVLSRRSLVEEDLKEGRDKFFEDTNVGDVLDGEVSSITTFGVFVNVGAVDGLVHLSELSWQRGGKVKEAFHKGDAVKVKVIGLDKEHGKVSLSIRQAEGDPWDTVLDRWTKGATVKGTVTNVTDFGAFVEVEPGIEGLVHIGDLSWSRVKNPREVVRKGQELDVIVLDIDANRRRMSLGCKQLNDPWKDIDSRIQTGSTIPVKVVRLADFGAFVEIEQGVEGLIHISQLSNARVENPRDVLSEGQEVEARVLEVNPETRRIRLSLRDESAAPAQNRAPRAERSERTERPERAERSERAERAERPERSERHSAPRKRREEPKRDFSGFSDEGAFTFGDLLGDFKLDDDK